jgi:peroxiredoxin Q/BCP
MNKIVKLKIPSIVTVLLLISCHIFAADLKVADSAPMFKLKTHEGKDFDLSKRKDQWTVLYFYPKAETPGCTKQACAFRDNIEKIRKTGADVFGISADTVDAQNKFHLNHKLNFTLLADQDAVVTELYGSKMPMIKMSKRWTFIIGPDLKIKFIEKDVDPTLDAQKTALKIEELQKTNSK